MSRRHGGQHGTFGFVAVLLTVKLLIKKSLFVADDLVTHQLLKAPLEWLMVELPFSVFGTAGALILRVTGASVPPSAVGLIAVYPILVAGVVALVEHPSPRVIASYWLGATLITTTAVTMSLGMLPDPSGIGSGLTYHLIHHTVAELLRSLVLGLGELIRLAGGIVGVEIDSTVGLIVSMTLVAVAYGIFWEKHVGHE